VNLIIHKGAIVRKLVYVYCFLAPLGNLVRFGSGEGALGLTTIILLLVVLLSWRKLLTSHKKSEFVKALILLFFWMILASLFAFDPLTAAINSANLFLYLILGIACWQYFKRFEEIRKAVYLFFLGGAIGGLFTIIDYLGIVNIAGVNEAEIGTSTEAGLVLQASGVFARRTAMGAYYILIITFGLVALLLGKNLSVFDRLFLGFTAIVCTITLMLTHNRSGILGAGLILVATLLLQSRSILSLLKLFLSGIIVAFAGYWVLSTYFSDVFVAYQALLGLGEVASANSEELQESDSARFVFALYVLKSLLFNPIGHGYSLIYGVPGHEGHLVDPHNLLSQVIWGSGIIGLIWLFRYGWRAFIEMAGVMRRKSSISLTAQLDLMFVATFAAFFLYNLTHVTISTGMFWILIGLFFANRKQLDDNRAIERRI
jgi:hypothetical protein